MPKLKIAEDAAESTGFKLQCGTGKGGRPNILEHNGKPVTAVSCRKGLAEFLKWLRPFGENIILAANNCRNFESKILTAALEKTKLFGKFTDTVCAFGEPMKLSMRRLPGRVSYSQESLMKDLLDEKCDDKDIVGKVAAMARLLKHFNCGPKEMCKFTFPSNECHMLNKYVMERAKNIASLQPLVAKGVI